ncbi:hypothetical protein [Almyronema epifaneia]|uniref:Uncharacterized protein n=1 Tax=Almyronema epifaneia S1 TaxID=2991925 RepID=A0ABW6IAX1_9CYAN
MTFGKAIALLGTLLSLVLGLLMATPAQAFSHCQNVAGQQICILSLKRSAKYYWQYRAEISVDGVKLAAAVYDCRRQVQIRSTGEAVPFQANGPGFLICSFFKK